MLNSLDIVTSNSLPVDLRSLIGFNKYNIGPIPKTIEMKILMSTA